MEEMRYVVCIRESLQPYRCRIVATVIDTKTARRVARRLYESCYRRGQWRWDIVAARIGGGTFFDFPYKSCSRIDFRHQIYTEAY